MDKYDLIDAEKFQESEDYKPLVCLDHNEPLVSNQKDALVCPLSDCHYRLTTVNRIICAIGKFS